MKANILSIVILLFCAITASSVNAATIYNYIGNPFTSSRNGTEFIGDWLTASITIFNPISSDFTGDIFSNGISQWTIQVAQVPNTRLDSNNAVLRLEWPLWFHLENGQITAWQMLAVPSFPQSGSFQISEIYTTRLSPYGSINSTSDEFVLSVPEMAQSVSYNNPGNWTRVQTSVPEPNTLLLFIYGSLMFLIKRKKAT